MIIIIISIWLAFLWILVSVGVLPRWYMWMKLSPIAIWLAVNFAVLLPMAWTAPSGPVIMLANSVPIAPSVSGRVVEVFVEGSVPLKRGDKLFTLDPVPFQAEVDRITARLELAEMRLEQKSRLLERETAAAVDVQEAQSSVDQLKAQLATARWSLERTVITAPKDGFVANVVVQKGGQVNAGQAVLPFIDTSAQIPAVQIRQSHIRHVKVGQAAEIVFPASPGNTYAAKVVKVIQANAEGQVLPSGLPMPSDTPSAEPFWVELQLENDAPGLFPGAAGTAAIFTDEFPLTHVIRRLLLRMETWSNFLFGA